MEKIRTIGVHVHALTAALPLLFVLFLGLSAVQSGFVPTHESYPPAVVDPQTVLDRRVFKQDLDGRSILILGVVDQPGDSDCESSAAVAIAKALTESSNAVVKVADPENLDCARQHLGDSVRYVKDIYAAARGCDVVVLACPWPEYVDIDYERLGEGMRRKLFLDGPMLNASDPAIAAGFNFLAVGKPSWPAWLDPELRAFAAQLSERVPEDAHEQQPGINGILMMPDEFATWNPRGRWYLHLNYLLFPRRLYLVRPQLASGTIGQFQEWIQLCISSGKPAPNELAEAAGRLKAGWLLTYSQRVDFLTSDFKLQSLTGGRQ